MDTTWQLDLSSEDVFEHVRTSDGEVVGYIAITPEGDFVPFDLLHRQVADPGELVVAEELLDEVGLSLLAETYLVERQGHRYRVAIKELTGTQVVVGPLSGDIGADDDVDLTQRWAYALPAPGLVTADA